MNNPIKSIAEKLYKIHTRQGGTDIKDIWVDDAVLLIYVGIAGLIINLIYILW